MHHLLRIRFLAETTNSLATSLPNRIRITKYAITDTTIEIMILKIKPVIHLLHK